MYRDPTGRKRRKTFDKKKDADRFLSQVDVDMVKGGWVDPKAGKIAFGQWAFQWFETRLDLRPSTRVRYQYVIDKYLIPEFGRAPLSSIQPLHVRRWVAGLSQKLAPASTKKAYLVLSQILKSAVENGLLAVSPCRGISLPPIEDKEMRFLTPEEVARLADSIDGRYRAMVLLGAYAGMRWGELAALRKKRLNLLRAEVHVVETLVDVDGRQIMFGPPKTRAGRRKILIPRELVPELATHMSQHCRGNSDLIFTTSEGHPLRKAAFRSRVWIPAVERAGLSPFRFHDLRHTAIALWIAAGAHVRQIKEWAGHSSTAVVLDRYGHVFPESADELRQALGDIYERGRSNGKRATRDGRIRYRRGDGIQT